MKKLLAALLLIPAVASAQYFAKAPAKNGGEIVLLAEKGTCTGNSLAAYVRFAGGRMVWGCWMFLGADHIHVMYQDGDQLAYESASFTVSKEWSEKLRQKGNTF